MNLIHNPFKEQKLRNVSLGLERGSPVRAYILGTVRDCISGEPCGSRTPCPQPPTATGLCLCQSLSWPGGRQTVLVAWLYPAPSHLHPLSCSSFLPPPLQHTSSQGHLQPGQQLPGPHGCCSLKNFPMRGGACVSPTCPSSFDQS